MLPIPTLPDCGSGQGWVRGLVTVRQGAPIATAVELAPFRRAIGSMDIRRMMLGTESGGYNLIASRLISRALRSMMAFVDDALPMPNDQREERDSVPTSGEEMSRRRRLRLKIRMLEKGGRGGFR